MKNKGFVVFLTMLISLLCIYYLSFTFVAQNIQKNATEASTNNEGQLDLSEKQRYLDSIWNEPVYSFLGLDYTYQDVKETELNLGLDLQGGMHVTLEVSPVDILKGLSGNSTDPDFLSALSTAKRNIKGTQLDFVDEFYRVFKEIAPDKNLSYVFANAANRGRINLNTEDSDILEIINAEVDDAIDRSFQILRTRIDRFGTSQPNIQKLQASGRIQIELPGVDNPERVRKLLQGVAKLEFWEIYEINEISDVITAINDMVAKDYQTSIASDDVGNTQSVSDDLSSLLTGDDADTTSIESSSSDEDLDTTDINLDSLVNPNVSPLFALLKSQYGLIYDVKDTSKINRILQRQDVKNLIPSTLKFLWKAKPFEAQEGDAIDLLELYPIKKSRSGNAPLTGEVITDARQDLDERSRPSISMQMNATGAKVWKRLTANNINRRLGVVLDDYVYSAPNVQGEIPNGNTSITGDFTIDEAKDLANILKAGALPAPTTIVEDVVIGPTLGKVAQNQGINSIFAGLIIVIIFMVIYYSKGGLIANVALFFNVFFILGILAQLSASLTLPGIAGIVLTIGMAIDANVLIFERIKEELRNGAMIKQAISSGYKKAYTSIIDANVTTLITGIILYSLGQGPVKGFAITLIIGIICSFFSAVFITRVIVETFAKSENSKISFSNAFSKNAFSNLKIDFLNRRKIAYIFSSIFITVGIVALFIKGLTLGVDFKGGRSYVVTFSDVQVPSQLKTSLASSFENQGTEVKTFGANNVMKITTSYLIDDESDGADGMVRNQLVSGLVSITGLNYVESGEIDEGQFTISSSSKVGATIADDIKNSSYLSAVFALICIFIYIRIRFRRWQFSVGAIAALFHDTLFVISAFAIANLFGISYEVDQVFVAAILTIIGYSINDTVVVFDRIRENIGIKSGSEMQKVFNESLNNTISRTLITSITTLIVVLILFLFGGAVLKGFSFALLVGIVIGTYSSIFIATPVAMDLSHKTAK